VPDRVAVLSLGAACIVPALIVLWKSASLRGDLHNKWADRVDIAIAGLDEYGVHLLRKLQVAIDHKLGEPDEGFDPDLVIEDPGPLVRLTRQFERAVVARRKARRRFKIVMELSAATSYLAALFIVGAVLTLLYYSDVYRGFAINTVGVGMCIVALVLGAALVGSYVYLEHKLATAEILGRSNRDAGSDGGQS
jgi:hypothetical protein